MVMVRAGEYSFRKRGSGPREEYSVWNEKGNHVASVIFQSDNVRAYYPDNTGVEIYNEPRGSKDEPWVRIRKAHFDQIAETLALVN